MWEHGELHPRHRTLRRQGSRSASNSRARLHPLSRAPIAEAHSGSSGALQQDPTRGPEVRYVGRVPEALHSGILSVFHIRRAYRGSGVVQLCPPGRPLFPRRPQAFRVSVADRFSHGSGARWHQESSDARQGVRLGHHEDPAASPGSPQHGA
ncbi:hypothetical protein NDU88_006541 [Pleurodeles waltl]|uniref:Uncharacterized protein n=1 Tax=Pleurodeles waltl TaxID=8319 RepID=A0AAV7NS51_PLEWA|nr:hypothetical protein NDU88_006541 [Pleurodeles waltl]